MDAVHHLPHWILTFCLIAMAGWHEAAAQDAPALSLPGEVRADTAYGQVGDWFVARDLEGTSLSDFGGRVLFVNVWATWCPPCVEELPAIVDLMDAVNDVDVAFLLVSIDTDERAVRRFLEAHALTVPVYFRGWQPGAGPFAGGVVPTTFIVNKKGAIVYRHYGAADWNTASIRRFLRELAEQ